MADKGRKLKNLLKAGVKKAKGEAKKYLKPKNLASKVVDSAKDKIKDRSKAQGRKHATPSPRVGIPSELGPDIQLGGKFELKGNRKKRKAKKKISKWENAKKASKMTEQQKFLAMDKKNKK